MRSKLTTQVSLALKCRRRQPELVSAAAVLTLQLGLRHSSSQLLALLSVQSTPQRQYQDSSLASVHVTATERNNTHHTVADSDPRYAHAEGGLERCAMCIF